MAKIVLIDPIHTGHHVSYARTLVKGLKENGHTVFAIGDTRWFQSFQDLVDGTVAVTLAASQARTLSGEKAKIAFIKECMVAAQSLSPDIIHFLYLDHFVLAAAFALPRHKAQIRATLHWGYMLPEFSLTPFHKIKSHLELWALRHLAARGMRIMVHSAALQTRLIQELKTTAIDLVPYPIEPMPMVERAAARRFVEAKTGLSERDRVILLFGDTRHDKGADLAIQALPLLPDHYHMLVAGKANDNEKAALRALGQKLGVTNRLHLQLQFIPDDEVPLYFKGSDTALIPYRKSFAGQSGPLTIAATLGVPVAAANLLVLAETVSNYKLGATFPPEKPLDIAATLKSLAGYCNNHAESIFCSAHSAKMFSSAVQKSYF